MLRVVRRSDRGRSGCTARTARRVRIPTTRSRSEESSTSSGKHQLNPVRRVAAKHTDVLTVVVTLANKSERLIRVPLDRDGLLHEHQARTSLPLEARPLDLAHQS